MTELSPRLEEMELRLLEEADAPELYELVRANREYLAQWMPWAADQDLAGTQRFILDTQAQREANNGFQVAITKGGPIIGVLGFHSIDWPNRRTSLGYWLAEEYQGRGIMTTAVRALVDYAFDEWDLHRVEIHCAPENRRSRAIPERLGFREEARLRETERVGDRWLDGVVYGLLRPEWSDEGG